MGRQVLGFGQRDDMSGNIFESRLSVIDDMDSAQEGLHRQAAGVPGAARGEGRRHVNAILAIALGVADKYVAAYYETHKRPESHVWKPWLDRLEQQVRQGLDALEARFAGPYMMGEKMTQADVTTVVVIDTIRFDMGHLAPVGIRPKLDDLVRRAMAQSAFAATAPG